MSYTIQSIHYKNINFCVSKRLLLLLVVLLSALQINAQRVASSIDKEKILIGQQLTLKLRVADLNKNNISIEQWFNVPDTFNHIEVVERSKIDTIELGSLVTYEQTIQLTSFDSGYWQMPSFKIILSDKKIITSDSFAVTVLPVDVTDLKDFHNIKEIVEVNVGSNWMITTALIIATVISLIALAWLLTKKMKAQVVVPRKIQTNLSPYDWALQQLKELQQKDLLNKQQHKLFYTELINICRNFSDMQFGFDTTTKTTDEYILSIKGMVGNEPVQTRYFQLLRLGDAVKFAKFTPDQIENIESIETAEKFIHTFNSHHNRS